MKLMKFFKRRKQRNKSELPGSEAFGKRYRQYGGSMPLQPRYYTQDDHIQAPLGSPTRASAVKLADLPQAVLERIFAFVCPHTQDSTYETQEQSSLEDACMLCDLRDLSHCVQVSRQWNKPAVKVLYVPTCRLPLFAAQLSANGASGNVSLTRPTWKPNHANLLSPHLTVTTASGSRQSITATAKVCWPRSASAGPSSTATANPKTPHRSD